MNATTISPNGRPLRKSLASQLDRLDNILDALSDGLNQAVATVVEDAVSKAVAVAVRELLTNSELLRAIHGPQPANSRAAPEPPPTAPPRPNLLRQILDRGRATLVHAAAVTVASLFSARSWVGTKVRLAVSHMAERCARIRDGFSSALLLLWHGRKIVLAALGAGLLVGLGCYHASPLVASTVSGLAAFAGSVAGAGRWLRRPLTAGAEAA